MTATITVQWQAPGHDAPLEAQGGILQVQPMQGWVAGDAIVNPKRQTYRVEAGQVVVTLDDSTARIWEFNHYPKGSPAYSHYKLIPPAVGAVAYTDEALTLVDPATAKPAPDELANALDTVAAGTVTTGTVQGGALILTKGDGTTVNAGTVTGSDGQSAYQIAVANGFVGTEAEWLASLKGADAPTITDNGTTVTIGA